MGLGLDRTARREVDNKIIEQAGIKSCRFCGTRQVGESGC